MSVFDLVREKLSIADVVEKYTGLATVEEGDNRLQMEDLSCPSCGHNDCFKIYPDNNNWWCFSEGDGGDASHLVSLIKSISDYEAAVDILKTYGIPIPKSAETTTQKIFNLAAHYYHTALLENSQAMAYQTETRMFSEQNVCHHKVGLADGGLTEFLRGFGLTDAELEESGLCKRSPKNGKFYDFFGKGLFVYPHFDSRGRASHFTIKDPQKIKRYQLSKKYSLNDVEFYGPTNLDKFKNVIIVEGETDKMALWQAIENEKPFDLTNENTAILACIGMVSRQQMEWIGKRAKGKRVLTFFDNDDSGREYRGKFQAISQSFEELRQFCTSCIPESKSKDIDEYLKKNEGTLSQFLATAEVELQPEEEGLSISIESANAKGKAGIIEKGNCYYKVKMTADGKVIPVQLTNFVIKLRNIYLKETGKEREVVFIREDGKRSRPTLISSTTKVLLRAFKEVIADQIDGSFYGGEEDMTAIWDYVYATGEESEVTVSKAVGHVSLGGVEGWMFSNAFLTDVGAMYSSDDSGVFWIGSTKSGVCCDGLEERRDQSRDYKVICKDIPTLQWDTPAEEAERILHVYMENLARNLGDIGLAITMTAWTWACVHSDALFYKSSVGYFPFMMLWGRHGKGKTNILKWNLAFYNMENRGYTTISQLRTAVGFERKAAFYASLPLAIDELRNDKETREHMPKFRGWYNRAGRSMGSKESGRVVNQEVRATFAFAGQDVMDDAASKERCLMLEIPTKGRETVESFLVLDSMARSGELTSVGAHWIKDAIRTDYRELFSQIKATKEFLVSNGSSMRMADVWSTVAPFGQRLADAFFPTFDYPAYLLSSTREALEDFEDDSISIRFLTAIEALLSSDRHTDEVAGEMVYYEDGKLYIWFAGIFDYVVKNSHSASRDGFSATAIRSELKDLECFVHPPKGQKSSKSRFSTKSKERRCLVFDLTKDHPLCLENIKIAVSP